MFLSEVLGAGPTQAPLQLFPALSLTQWVKNPPAMQETQETRVQYLGQEDPLEKEMATYSSVLAWKVSRTEEPGRLQPKELQRVRQD